LLLFTNIYLAVGCGGNTWHVCTIEDTHTHMQALSNTHIELMELVLADVHAGPGLLEAWLQVCACANKSE